jgi:hypothetical protein
MSRAQYLEFNDRKPSNKCDYAMDLSVRLYAIPSDDGILSTIDMNQGV